MKNYRLKLKILNFKLLFFILIFTFYIFGAFSALAQTDEEKMADLKAQIQALEQQAQQLKGTISQKQEQANTLKGQIANLKGQITSLQAQISLTGKKIDKTKIEINNVQNDIFDTQNKISKQKSTIAQLLLFMDRMDKENLLSIILKNNDLSDYFRQTRSAVTINSNLMNLVNDLQNTENQLSQNKNNLEEKKSDLESLKQQQNAQKISLSQTTQGKNQLLKRTKSQELEYQKLLAETEELQRQANLEVFKLEEQMRRAIDPNSLPLARPGVLAWPVEGIISQKYGCVETSWARRNYPSCNNKKGGFHNGLDIAAQYGTPLRAAENGKVIAVGNAPYAYGVWATVEHDNGLVTAYTHMSVRSVSVGQEVKSGDVVGNTGRTGLSTGYHIHFMVYAPKTFTTKPSAISGILPIGATLNPADYL